MLYRCRNGLTALLLGRIARLPQRDRYVLGALVSGCAVVAMAVLSILFPLADPGAVRVATIAFAVSLSCFLFDVFALCGCFGKPYDPYDQFVDWDGSGKMLPGSRHDRWFGR